MAISIRLARMSDLECIRDLTSQLGYEVDVATVAARLSSILLRSDQRFVVAELGGPVQGWLHAVISEFIETERFVTIGGLVVDKNHRKKASGGG